ncbi:MAG: lysophospholipase [Rhodobacteraceae bacterium]|nr:lysophospholipase [Paracoccaceae bacterium]
MACFRYDKRGVGKSGGDYPSAGHSDLVEDAAAITRHFSKDPDILQVFLLGHSEGTIIAPQVAQAIPVGGMILLAPFVTPMIEILAQQGAAMQKSVDAGKGVSGWFVRLFVRLSGGIQAINARLIKRVESTEKPVVRQFFRKVEARWMREMLAQDASQVFIGASCPTLVLVAGNDVQCPPKDGDKITAIIGENATQINIEGLSHILRIEAEARGFASYPEQLKRPMADEVLVAVENWLVPLTKP